VCTLISDNKKRISISLDKELVELIDEKRGNSTKSEYIEIMLKKILNFEKNKG